ncbi:hypothetical protein F1B92_04940 [Campylobacter sp. FMV-PI01]|uniref:Outer membrane cytochrome MtrC/MtrF-like domain-containing protein n=1 Tax=Campylobacter portucalensis TaxID=2608384 RepID=A0A6L5WHG0_9BACT|nr:multiheme c-type cytochrome [Campylobacter portucalensis]MSN96519.1 hypothetical protein [Campylobacter portucalensis]
MIRFVFFILLIVNCCFSNIIHRFTQPENCKSCHKEQYEMWSTSLHAKSHELNNELYKKSVKMVALEMNKPYDKVLITCSNCHNPRLEIKNIDNEYIIAKAFGVETSKTKEVNQALNAKHIQNGISCYICHNVDSIKPRTNQTQVGYQNFNWIGDDTIVGPYEDESNRAGFHKIGSRDFFKQTDDLCLSCHQGQVNKNPLAIYNTGQENTVNTSEKRCVDCHMGELSKGIIAPHIKPKDAITRDIRPHIFAGVRNNPNLLKNNISIRYNNGILYIKNLATHKIPTGFSGRSVVLKFTYLDIQGKEISNDEIKLRIKHTNNNLETLSYSAQKVEFDTRLNAFETRQFKINAPQNATKFRVDLIYYIIDPNLQKKLEIEDPNYTKPYEISSYIFDI